MRIFEFEDLKTCTQKNESVHVGQPRSLISLTILSTCYRFYRL